MAFLSPWNYPTSKTFITEKWPKEGSNVEKKYLDPDKDQDIFSDDGPDLAALV